jgi:hypothetical protein
MLRMTRPLLALFSCAVLFAANPKDCASDEPNELDEVLEGIRAAELVIERLDGDTRDLGLTRADLRRNAERWLGSGGTFRVVPREEAMELPGVPALYLRVGGTRAGSVFVYRIELAMIEDVRLERKPDEVDTARTWTRVYYDKFDLVEEVPENRDTLLRNVLGVCEGFGQLVTQVNAR